MRTYLLVLALAGLCPLVYSQVTHLSDLPILDRAIVKSEIHTYQIKLAKHEKVMVGFKQKGADVQLLLIDPRAKERSSDSNNDDLGLEPLLIEADTSGTYQIKVSLFQEKGKGVYDVSILDRQMGTGDLIKDLDLALSMWIKLGHLPGAGTAMVSSDKVLFSNGYGWADRHAKAPYGEKTIHNIGSVSKTTIGLALMQLVEQGKLTLNTPVNDFLPFKVENPRFPDNPITIRHLATHTSSINEMPAYEKSYIIKEPHQLTRNDLNKDEYRLLRKYEKNEQIPMADFLRNILSEDGKWYSRKSYTDHAPGQRYQYSNCGATLAAHVVELVSGMTFSDYTTTHILQPLGMNDSGWSFDVIDYDRHAKLYLANGKSTIPKYTLVTYPDGGLLTSVHDLSIYLQELIKGKSGLGTLLSARSYQEMMSPLLTDAHFDERQQGDNAGIFWDIGKNGGEGHSGGDPGIVTLMYFDPDKSIGGIIMTNCGLDDPVAGKQFVEMWKLINRYSHRYVETQAE